MSNQERKTSLAVIGAGPGGYAAAFLAADLGMEVTLIDPEKRPGGVCLYRGCIPTKALLHACSVRREIDRSKQWGLKAENVSIDLDSLRQWKESVVKKLTGGLGQLVSKRKIDYIRGRARFLDPHSLEVTTTEKETQKLAFDHAIIATGSYPTHPKGLPEHSKRVMNSEEALNIEDIPESLLVIGGGYIGLELGTVYATLGSKVSIVEMMPQLMPGSDADLIKAYMKGGGNVFENIYTETTAEIKEKKGRLHATLKNGKEKKAVSFDKVLVTVGRKALTRNLGLENTGVETDDKGFVLVDEQRRTQEESIYAIGDVTGPPLLAHKATHEGRVAVEAIDGRAAAFDPHAIPSVEYTDPEIAWCGMTQKEAEEKGINVEVSAFPWAASGRAATLGRAEGITKLVFDSDSRRIIGAGIVGADAGELISETTLAIEMAARDGDLAMTIHPHPTLSETIMEAAEAYQGSATDIYRPKKMLSKR
ncbi:MAG: dihydrolipoyl dehydrogenase [Chitinivibrionales bacterium]|nr:dihydrolipoyl dehydrogenase [Chitinivibrionales bacterium]